jgi:uncharacterized membrane protein YgcG
MLLRRILVAGLFLPLTLFAYSSPGKPSGYVNDFGQMLMPGTISEFNQTLSDFYTKTGNQISAVTRVANIYIKNSLPNSGAKSSRWICRP